jgi:hypothetical protein
MDPEEARSFRDKTRKKWKSRIRGFKDTLFRTETGRSIFTPKRWHLTPRKP